MDFDFSRFSPRSFERFAQALTIQQLGGGLSVFGDGPDGAREASYRGRLAFPSDGDAWDGYTVVQVKFRQNGGDAASDAAWLVRELRSELRKYLDKERKLQKPQYYLLITNARLSAVPATSRGRGGLEKIDDVFEEFRKEIGIRDYRVWHYDELCARLAGAETIRRAHAAWVTPSDVLAEVMNGVSFSRPDFGAVMHLFLQRELRNQQATRLQQAGHGGETATHLEDVFIDLPYVVNSSQNPPKDLLLAGLARRSAERLTPDFLKQSSPRGPRPERLLLLGGPGQGKSTVSQFFAQLLRARLLSAERQRPLTPEVEKIVRSVLDSARHANLAENIPLRFPVRVELPLFADMLSLASKDGKRLSLLEHIRTQIAEIAEQPDLTLGDLRLWLGAYPFVLLLDGLDEVPSSANRPEVISAINEFWDEASGVLADVLMLVTTRPQGYNDDLDPALYTTLEMSKLEAEHALAYAEKLADIRLSEPGQRKRVLQRLTEATENPTISHLLVSPLQVAIMLALIDQRGEAPSDRWSLFDKYFDVVLEREQQKPGPAGLVVKNWSRTIGALHHAIGFALHLQAESGGGSDSHVSRASLEELIRDQLRHDGYEAGGLENAANELLSATTDRLVLLVQRVDQRYSFEVRSLQEFMAAAFLMSGPQLVVQERLREIANKSHWRHVYLIAASKCFASNDTLHYRDTILNICHELDTDQGVDAELKSGARLALSLLEDGLAHDQPLWRRKLLLAALEVVHTGAEATPPAIVGRAGEYVEASTYFLRPLLRSSLPASRMGAWRVVLHAAVRGEAWAVQLACDEWPGSVPERLSIMAIGFVPSQCDPLMERFRDAIAQAGPVQCLAVLGRRRDGGESALNGLEAEFEFLSLLRYRPGPKSSSTWINLGKEKSPLSFDFVSIDSAGERQRQYETLPDTAGWQAFKAVGAFHREPGARSLAATLREIDQDGCRSVLEQVSSQLPWPLLTLVKLYAGKPFPSDLIERGILGDAPEWRTAEQRWRATGLEREDMLAVARDNSFGHNVGRVGMPWPSSISLEGGAGSGSWFRVLIETARGVAPPARWLLNWIVDFCLEYYRVEPQLNERDVLETVLGKGRPDPEERIGAEMVYSFSPTAWRSERVLTALSARCVEGSVGVAPVRTAPDQDIALLLSRKSADRPELLILLVSVMGSDLAGVPLPGLVETAAANQDHPDPGVSGAANLILLLTSHGGGGDVRSAMEAGGLPFGVKILADALKADLFGDAQALAIAQRVNAHARERWLEDYGMVQSQLSRLADRRRSQLADEACWGKLGLRGSLCRSPDEAAPHARICP